jgi:hypothetical protein
VNQEHVLLSQEANDILRANTAEARAVLPNKVRDSMRPEAEARVRSQLHQQMAALLQHERVEKRDLGDTTEYRLRMYVIDDSTLYRLIQQEAMRFSRYLEPMKVTP